MSASKQWVLVRESRAAAGSALRFASEPQSGAECKLLMEQWRDTHNTSLTAGQMKKEGRVVAAPLTGSLAEEWASFRTRFADWTPLAPPDGMFHAADVAAAAAPAGATEPVLPQSGECYVRQPALHGNQLVFVCEGDLWYAALPPPSERMSLPVQPTAARITVDGGCAHPLFSPDGALVAFSRSVGDAAAELCVMAPLDGRPPRQLTHVGDAIAPVAWEEDGSHLIARTAAGQPMAHMSSLVRVPVSTDAARRPSPLGLGIAHHAAALPGGALLLGRQTVDPAHGQWKGYRGGCGGTLWHGSPGAAMSRLSLPSDWNVGHPMVFRGRVYFVSDHTGTSNLHSVPLPLAGDQKHHSPFAVAAAAARTLADDLASSVARMDVGDSDEAWTHAAVEAAASTLQAAQHTRHACFGVREPALDAAGGGWVAFHCAAQLHLLQLPLSELVSEASDAEGPLSEASDAEGRSQLALAKASGGRDAVASGAGGAAESIRVPLRRIGAPRHPHELVLMPSDELEEFALHAEGHSLVAVVRGRLFALPGLWEGAALPLGLRDGARYTCAACARGGRVVAAECGPLIN